MRAATFRSAGRDWPAATIAAIGHIGPDGKPTGMTRRHIVTTAPDGGVLITTPSLTAMCFMACGGGRWDEDIAREPPGFLDRQIAEQAKHGVGEQAARRFVMAMQCGGCTVDEAYEVMRDRFAAHLGIAHELWDTADIPADRTYRAAWRRSQNGGPIWIDERKVMEIDEHRAWLTYERERRTGGELGAS
jgi:hypothetical protein